MERSGRIEAAWSGVVEVGEIQPNDMLPGGIAQEERRGGEEAGGWPEIIEIGKFPEIDYDHDFDFGDGSKQVGR